MFFIVTLEICKKIFPCQSKLITHHSVHNKSKSQQQYSQHQQEEEEEYLHSNEELEQQQQQGEGELYQFSQQREVPIMSLPAPVYHFPTTRGQLVQYILNQEIFQNQSTEVTKEFIVPTRQLSSAYPCEICHQIFRKKTILRTHKLSAHGVAEYRCGKLILLV